MLGGRAVAFHLYFALGGTHVRPPARVRPRAGPVLAGAREHAGSDRGGVRRGPTRSSSWAATSATRSSWRTASSRCTRALGLARTPQGRLVTGAGWRRSRTRRLKRSAALRSLTSTGSRLRGGRSRRPRRRGRRGDRRQGSPLAIGSVEHELCHAAPRSRKPLAERRVSPRDGRDAGERSHVADPTTRPVPPVADIEDATRVPTTGVPTASLPRSVSGRAPPIRREREHVGGRVDIDRVGAFAGERHDRAEIESSAPAPAARPRAARRRRVQQAQPCAAGTRASRDRVEQQRLILLGSRSGRPSPRAPRPRTRARSRPRRRAPGHGASTALRHS